MNIRIACSAVAVAAVLSSAALRAQDAMNKPMGMDKEKSYTGCLEADAAKGTFRLSQAMHESAMGMAKDKMAKDKMSHDAMEMSTLSISSKQVDLAKHVGHKVTVTGTDDAMGKEAHAFLVKSLKMVAGRCGS